MHKFLDKFGLNRERPAANTQDAFGQLHTSTGATSTSESASSNDPRSANIREKAGRFRILIIGRANAGKTTILQKICNTVGRPDIFDTQGKKIKRSILTPSVERGKHNINHELVFKSNPRFVFHDSTGFEAGGVEELTKVKQFVTERSGMVKLSEQLHVIWYCIPMDDERPFTRAEQSFFAECGTGSVPVVALFTKFDALEDVAYGKLTNEGIPHDDAVKQTADRAVADFEREYLPIFEELKFPPKGRVYLRDMNKPEADCRGLVDTVAAVLGNTDLQQLFVSTQRNNLGLCMKYAVENELIQEILTKRRQEPSIVNGVMSNEFQERMACWFPHCWDSTYRSYYYGGGANRKALRRARGATTITLGAFINTSHLSNIQSEMISFTGSPPAHLQIARFGIALAIILEHSFYLWDQSALNDTSHLITAINVYKTSGKHVMVMEATEKVFEEEMPVHFIEEVQGTFTQKLIQVALENRLSPS